MLMSQMLNYSKITTTNVSKMKSLYVILSIYIELSIMHSNSNNFLITLHCSFNRALEENLRKIFSNLILKFLDNNYKNLDCSVRSFLNQTLLFKIVTSVVINNIIKIMILSISTWLFLKFIKIN